MQKSIVDKAQSLHLQAFERKRKLLVPPGHAISWDTAEVCFDAGLWGMCDRSLVINLDGIPRRTQIVDSFDLNNFKFR